MKLKHLILALGLVSVAGMANATATKLGTIDVGVIPTQFFGYSAPGTFSDIFTFALPANGGSGYSVMNLPVPAANFNALLTTMSLVKDIDGTPFSMDDEVVFSVVSAGTNSFNLAWGALDAGSYYLNIAGITTGTAGGLYSGAISVTPVPEPETWAMLLAGLGIVALKLNRRSNARKISIN